MKRLLMLAGLLLLMLAPAAAQDAGPSFCVSVWYREREQPGGLESIADAAGLVDVVHPMWYTSHDDGTINVVDVAEDPAQLAAWRDAGMHVMPSVFSTISLAIETADTRALHVAELAALVERMDYDGLDIDFEEFGLHTRDAFSAFIEELAAALHADGRLLSVTLMAKTDEAGRSPGAAAQDWPRLAAAVDRVNLMTYDYTGRGQPPGPISPPVWVVEVLDYAATVMDLRRVHFGMALYGYGWQRGNPPARATTWESVQPWIESFGAAVERDPLSGEAVVDFKPPGVPRQVVVYNDAESVRARLAAVIAAHPDIGGLSIWGAGGEDPAIWDALAELRPAPCAP